MTEFHTAVPDHHAARGTEQTTQFAVKAARDLFSGCPDRALEFARAMHERTAWDIDPAWHLHWGKTVAVLAEWSRGNAPPRQDVRPTGEYAPDLVLITSK